MPNVLEIVNIYTVHKVEGHNSAWNSLATAVPREKRKLRNTLEQELTYGVIRKFEDGARCYLSLSAWPRMLRAGMLRCSISVLLTILYITRSCISFSSGSFVGGSSSASTTLSHLSHLTIYLHVVRNNQSQIAINVIY